MSKNNNNYVSKKNEAKTKTYKNPTKTVWGKIIIWIIAILTATSGLISLVYLIWQNMM